MSSRRWHCPRCPVCPPAGGRVGTFSEEGFAGPPVGGPRALPWGSRSTSDGGQSRRAPCGFSLWAELTGAVCTPPGDL